MNFEDIKMSRRTFGVIAAALAAGGVDASWAAENAGAFSQAGLARIAEALRGRTDRGEVPGIVTLVSRKGVSRRQACRTCKAACPGDQGAGSMRLTGNDEPGATVPGRRTRGG